MGHNIVGWFQHFNTGSAQIQVHVFLLILFWTYFIVHVILHTSIQRIGNNFAQLNDCVCANNIFVFINIHLLSVFEHLNKPVKSFFCVNAPLFFRNGHFKGIKESLDILRISVLWFLPPTFMKLVRIGTKFFWSIE